MEQLREADWNPNQMDEAVAGRLTISVTRYGLVQNLVVRAMNDDEYEVLSGNQRLQVLRKLEIQTVPCVVVDLNDAHAKLLSQALNRIQGDDDLGLKAELLREILDELPQEEVLNLLPETADSLKAMASMGHENMAKYLPTWNQAQCARLKHLTFQSLPDQAEVIEEALSRFLPQAKEGSGNNPNVRGTALYLLCKSYLARGE